MKYFILITISTLFLSGCSNCKLWGDNNLGGDFTLLEGDKINDRLIVYCTSKEKPEDCCTSGIPIIPSREDKSTDYIEIADYNEQWIIVKGVNIDKSESYWYINKDFDTSWEYDDGGIFYNRIQNNVYGPYDKSEFEQELKTRNINLKFDSAEE
ncbi:MAG: hypothetical protein ABJN84_17845 [Flavobacteriaceae bacterium]